MLALPYTICFCLRGSQVLLLYRNKAPNASRWNGLGGKIERGETPLMAIQRELMEEAAIDVRQALDLSFTGIVTWTTVHHAMDSSSGGMYTFLARLAPDFPIWPDRPMNEGLLSWKTLAWACDPRNRAVVSNVPRFLPLMLANPRPQEYSCVYRRGALREMTVRALPEGIASDRMPE